MTEPFYEERRTTPDSVDLPIWGHRQGDRFFPWMTASHDALFNGWPVEFCGPNVSPDGSVIIPEPEETPEEKEYWNKVLKPMTDMLSERFKKTLDGVIKDADLRL